LTVLFSSSRFLVLPYSPKSNFWNFLLTSSLFLLLFLWFEKKLERGELLFPAELKESKLIERAFFSSIYSSKHISVFNSPLSFDTTFFYLSIGDSAIL